MGIVWTLGASYADGFGGKRLRSIKLIQQVVLAVYAAFLMVRLVHKRFMLKRQSQRLVVA